MKKYFLSGLCFHHGIVTDANSYFQGINLPELTDLSVQNIVDYYAEQVEDGSDIYAWSLAGLFAILLANQHPGKVNQLHLVNTTPLFVEHENWSGMSEPYIQELKKLLSKPDKFMKKFSWLCAYPNKQNVENIKPYIMTDKYMVSYFDFLISLDVRNEFQQLNSKANLILSEHDVVMQTKQEDLMRLNSNLNILHRQGEGHAVNFN